MTTTSQSKSASPKRKPAQPATKKPGYWESVSWIALNDGSAADALAGLADDPNQAITIESLSQLLTVTMLADMYGMEPRNVALDIIRSGVRP